MSLDLHYVKTLLQSIFGLFVSRLDDGRHMKRIVLIKLRNLSVCLLSHATFSVIWQPFPFLHTFYVIMEFFVEYIMYTRKHVSCLLGLEQSNVLYVKTLSFLLSFSKQTIIATRYNVGTCIWVNVELCTV